MFVALAPRRAGTAGRLPLAPEPALARRAPART